MTYGRHAICVCSVVAGPKSGFDPRIGSSASVVTGVVFHFASHDRSPLATFIKAATWRTRCACNVAVLISRTCAIDGATSAAAALADVQRDLVAELDGLKVAFGIVQL